MSEEKNRIQGGVFIWFSALSSSASALVMVCRSYNGFWEFLLACLAAAVVAGLAYFVLGILIAKRAGRLEDEIGPLIGLVCIGASIFLVGYYARLRACPEQPPYVTAWLVWSFLSLGFSYVSLLIGRGLNKYGTGLMGGRILQSWSMMGGRAQTMCMVVSLIAVVGLSFAFGDILLNGLKLQLWMILTNSIFSSCGILVLFASLRKAMLKLFTGHVWSKCLEGRCPKVPHVVLGETFSIHEICASVAFGGVVALVFIACPLLFDSSYALTMALGAILSFAMLCTIWCLDERYFLELLRQQWRKEMMEYILPRREEFSKRHAKAVRSWIMNHFMRSGESESGWDDVAGLHLTAERVRRTLNARFCEDGRMRYISRYELLDRREVMALLMARLYDRYCDVAQVRLKVDDDLSDDDLQRCYEEVEKLSMGEDSRLVETDAASCISDLMPRIVALQIRPRCRMILCFRKGGGCRCLEMELDDLANAGLTENTGTEDMELMQFASGSADDAIRQLEGILAAA